jgi:hypothetical protein
MKGGIAATAQRLAFALRDALFGGSSPPATRARFELPIVDGCEEPVSTNHCLVAFDFRYFSKRFQHDLSTSGPWMPCPWPVMTTSPNAIDVRTLDRHSKTGLATNARGDLHERFVMATGVLARMRAETLISDIRPQKDRALSLPIFVDSTFVRPAALNLLLCFARKGVSHEYCKI